MPPTVRNTTQMLIGGVDYNRFCVADSLQITQNFGRQGDQLTVSLIDEHPTNQPSLLPIPMQTLFYKDVTLGKTIFGGVLNQALFRWVTPTLTQWDLTATDFTFFADNAIVTGDYVNLQADQIIKNLTSQANCGITTANVLPGPVIPRVKINHLQLSAAWTRVAKYASSQDEFDWFVDENRDLHFFSWGQASASPYYMTDDVTDTGPFAAHYSWNNMQYLWDGTSLRNRITVRGANFTLLTTDHFSGDGLTNAWPMTQPLDTSTPRLSLFIGSPLVAKSIAIYTGGGDPPFNATTQFVVVQAPNGQWFLHQGTDALPGTSTAPVAINLTYQALVPIVTRADDLVSQAKFTALGNAGIFEMYIADTSITSLLTAKARAQRELIQYSDIFETITATTTEDFTGHIRTGDVITFKSLTIPDASLNNIAGLNTTYIVVGNTIQTQNNGWRTYTIQATRIGPGGVV